MAIPRKAPAKAAAKRVKKSSAGAGAADMVDEQLARYRSMRDFSITAEPSGTDAAKKSGGSAKKSDAKKTAAAELPFVIQKHAATRLHYDFRLGWNGVLKSWAVAKGPSYVTADKRLAVQVEDHPMEYGGFEGIIPQGQYGGGTVMLWDNGTWAPQPGHEDVDEGLRRGSLKFILYGTKMKGNWALIRMGGRAAGKGKPNWLLIKEHDRYERTPEDAPITEEKPNSVVTRRSLEQIARSEDHVWNSKETAKGKAWHRKDAPDDVPNETLPAKASASKKPSVRVRKGTRANARISAAPREKLPAFIPPELAFETAVSADGSGWVHELKLDGYRIQARKDGDEVRLLTRTGLDWTHRMKAIAAHVAALPAETALLDGEVVVVEENGTTSFAALQAAFQEGVKRPLTYFVFDLLHFDGHTLRGLPLTERKTVLHQLVGDAGEYLRYSDHIESSGETVFQKACELHAEGIISKRGDAPYRSGRSGDWVKRKCVHEQEFVIGGFTLPSNGSHGIGSLLLGYYEGKHLIYAGRTGTGFTQKTHRLLRDKLDKLRQSATPFHDPPPEAFRKSLWVRPELVAQVSFATWTADNVVRQAAFHGLREDKPADQVRREEPTVNPRRARHAAPVRIAAKSQAAPKTHEAKAAKTRSAEKKSPIKNTADGDFGFISAGIRITHPEKVLDPESGLTKQQLADYYRTIAPHMLPYVAGRPLSLVRCPEGDTKPCFFQKHANDMVPEGIESVPVPDKKTGKPEAYITLSTPEGLAALAQMGVLEVHPWGSRNDDLEHPDLVVFDLDPDPSIAWTTLAESAAEVRRQLKKLGLESFLKTTGGKGLHVVIPIEPEHEWPAVKEFAHSFVLEMEKREPSLYLTKMSKAARKDRIFLDYLRNERGATAIAPYSPRARAGAFVALPLSWTDLKLSERPAFPVLEFPQWKRRLSRDPWEDFLKTRQRLDLKG
jgi:bifunctional non-homologous end joining protein LigD